MPKCLCVIIDGLSADTLACAHVPYFDGLAREGVLAPQLQPIVPRLTLPGLVSLTTSLPPEAHGIHDNSGSVPVSPAAVSLFSLLRYRHQSSAAFYSNDRLRLLFPPGSLQTGMLINSQGIRNVDLELAHHAALHLQREKPDFCMLYLEGAAIASTHFGRATEAYLESVEQADRVLGLMLEHLTLVGLHREYILMVMGCSDSSPLAVEGERSSIPWLVTGPGVRKGHVLNTPPSVLDLAPTMATFLDLAPHPDWRGRVLTEVMQRSPRGVQPLVRPRNGAARKSRITGRSRELILTKV